MNLLAIDTSTKTLCVGLDDGSRRYAYDVNYGPRLSRCLVPAIERVLASAGLAAGDIDCFACGLGPGSFTGIRIGMATIKGLAWGMGKPVIGVPSLDVICRNCRKEEGPVVSVVDARRGMVYAGLYRMKKGKAVKTGPYFLGTPEDLLKELKLRWGKKHGEIVMCGDGIPVIKAFRKDLPGIRLLDSDYWKPQGRSVLELAQERAEKKSDAAALKPIYLYPSDCQVRSLKA